MDILRIITYALILYGIATLYITYAKPKSIWELGKIQGFVQLLTEKGTVIFFTIVGVGALVGGVYLLVK